MKKTVFRPCAICAHGILRIDTKAKTKTCSDKCSNIYARNARKFYVFTSGWHRANDVPTYKNSVPFRIGDTIILRTR